MSFSTQEGRGNAQNMILEKLYRGLLQLPQFKGKSRLETFFRFRLRPHATHIESGFDMYLDPLEWMQITLLSGQTTEPETTRLFERLLKPGDIYIDVGAHVGFHTLLARRCVGAEGRVIAIEPQPYNCDKILSNWHLNGYENLLLYVAVAGRDHSLVRLHNQAAADRSRLSLALNAPNDLPQTFCVPMLRLDAIIPPPQDVAKVKLLKIDAEGYEAEVLEGLGVASGRVENIVIEVLTQGETELKKSNEAIELLRNWDFHLYDVNGRLYRSGMPLTESNLWAACAPIPESRGALAYDG